MRTTYHDFDGWPRPQRAPQHAAAPFGLTSPARLKAQRALRLFATAGLWAAGLCLVIGAIVLIVAQAKRGRLTPASVRTSMRAGHLQPPSARPAASRPARTTRRIRGTLRPRQLATFAGHGDKTTASFRVAAGAGWQIQWSYACARAVRAGLFVVEDARTGAAGASITQSGVAGQRYVAAPGRPHASPDRDF